ncbi:solute carrier organic anion transporter family member 4C1 [Tiliqua scincoides]|uniref:solute carrier organic anion transporter family member 4C1 n=1 Tax=Tiliqua scincoides TaxID=71010 RepID=UPI0034628B72
MAKRGVDNPAFEPPTPSRGSEDKLSQDRFDRSPSYLPEEQLCGIGRFVPPALQICNNAKGYLLFYSLLSVFQGTLVNGLVNVGISSIEKRYELNSSLTGIISAGYDISFCLLCLFISFYGERGHKPRWLALAAFLIGLGALVFSVPHFTGGLYTYGDKVEETCPVTATKKHNATMCAAKPKSTLSNYFYVFMLGQLLMGAGGTPLYTLGTAFIDDSVPKHKASVYIGIGYAMSLLGPAFGYVLGGQLLNIYVDFDRRVSLDIKPDDPRWIGAWWIGFVICGFATWLLVVPFSYFPKHLPGSEKIQAEKISEVYKGESNTCSENKELGKSIKDFPATLWVLLKNSVFMCLVIADSLEALVATGFATFLPKFIENQFGFTSSYSATLGGIVLVPGAAIGQIISGFFISKLKLSCKSIIKFIVVTCMVAFGLNMVFLFANCGNEPFAGVTETYNGTGTSSSFAAPCNAHCKCLRSYYVPVCGTDEVQYFSPCYAGCSESHITTSETRMYTNCSCVVNPTIVIDNITHGATAGKCKSKCTVLPLFLSIFFFAVVFTFLSVTPTTVAVLRCVPDRHRSFAMGVQMLFLRILGTIPGPILFGITIDSTCTLWSVDKCGVKGSCWTYNNRRMAYMLMTISAVCKGVSIIFSCIACFLYKPPPNQTTPSEDKDESLPMQTARDPHTLKLPDALSEQVSSASSTDDGLGVLQGQPS